MLNVNDVSRLYLGIQGENGARPIEIDVKPWLVAHPQGSVSIWHKRNGDSVPSPTGAVFDDDEGIVTWTPSSTDTYVSGEGVAEIRLTEGNVIKKTRTVITGVSPSLTGAGVPLGSDWASYIAEVDRIKGLAVVAKQGAEQAEENAEAWAVGQRGGVDVESDDPTYENNAKYYSEVAAEEAEAAAEDAERILGMNVTANTLGENEDATASYNHNTGLMTLGIPRGKSAKITSETEQYQLSVSGTVVPTGTWLNERPDLVQGEFLWIKRTRVWNNSGQTRVSYEAYYTPQDGDSPTLAYDEQPTEGSQKIPRSGGTYTMIQTKAKKVTTATEGNLAAFDANGDLADSGEDPDELAHKVSGGIEGNLVALDENGDLTDSGEDPDELAHKVSGGSAGNFPMLDANGDLVDSNHKHSDYVTDKSDKLDKTNAADLYDNTATYAVGDLCIHENGLYRCTTAIGTAEDWTAAHWTATTIEDELASNKTAIANLKSATESNMGIVETGDTCTHTGGIAAGQYVIWKGALYTADAAISVGETFASSGGSKNLTACDDGGLNALNSNNTIAYVKFTATGSGMHISYPNGFNKNNISVIGYGVYDYFGEGTKHWRIGEAPYSDRFFIKPKDEYIELIYTALENGTQCFILFYKLDDNALVVT